MSRFARHFAADVLRHTGASALLAALVFATLQTFRAARRLAGEAPLVEVLIQGAQETVGALHAAWPVVCGIGFAWSVLRWRRLGQDEIVAGTGRDPVRIVLPGLGLASVLLVAGALVLRDLGPRDGARALRWHTPSAWGAALPADDGWAWVELGDDGASVAHGRAPGIGDLPNGAADALRRQRRARDPWFRWPLLLLCAGAALRGARYAPPLRAPLTLGSVVAAGFLFGTLQRIAAALLEGSFLAARPDLVAIGALLVGGIAIESVLKAAGRPYT